MQQSFDADNQQASLCELSWLGGIIDGEGCITMKKVSHKGYKTQSVFPMVTISNTNLILVNKVKSIFENYDIEYHIYQNKPKNYLNKITIQVISYKQIIKFIKLILPYLIGKKPQAMLLLEFCMSRIEKLYSSYTSNEKQVCNKIWELNEHGTTCWETQKASTTTCIAPVGMKI